MSLGGNDPYYPYGSNFKTATDGWFISQPGANTPNSYPPQPNAPVHISWAVISVIPIQKFTPVITGGQPIGNDPHAQYITYQTISDSFFCNTTVSNFPADVPPAITPVYNYFASQAGQGFSCEIHWTIKIDNVTAPPPPRGAWVQAKAHMDGHLAQNSIKSASDIYTPLESFIPFLQSESKY